MSVQTKGEKVYRGTAVSGGVCRGKVLVLHHTQHLVSRRALEPGLIPEEIRRFEQVLVKTRTQIKEVQRRVAANMSGSEADIFDAHLLMLEDRVLIDEVMRLIREDLVNAEFAFQQVSGRYVAAMESVEDELLRERAADMRDLVGRVMDNLLQVRDSADLNHLTEPCILVSRDLSPSTTAQLNKKLVLGFATDIGGKSSHTAIMARSLDIPAVVGLQTLSEELETGDYVLLDGYNGTVVVNPTDATLFEYGQLAKLKASLDVKLAEVLWLPAVTLDGKAVHLSANIEDQLDVEAVIAHGAEGVGLFRTEFLFLNRPAPPNEDEQWQVYHEVAAALHPNPVIIRTLDLGGDKFVSSLQLAPELNSFLGWRAIRFCLAQPDMFCHQLRAILRASSGGNVKMMYPMISGVDELNQANALLEKCKQELKAKEVPFNPNMEIGVMIEIPSAALIADALAQRARFFSIGSNDLIQYTLAADRTNEKVSHLYEPTHPAILKLIKNTVEASHRHGIWTGVCGEIGGDPILVPLLLGLGVDELSAAPPVIPEVKYMIRKTSIAEARQLADFALQCDSPSEIYAACQKFALQTAPSLFEKT